MVIGTASPFFWRFILSIILRFLYTGVAISTRSTLKEVPKDKPCTSYTMSSITFATFLTMCHHRDWDAKISFISICSRVTVALLKPSVKSRASPKYKCTQEAWGWDEETNRLLILTSSDTWRFPRAARIWRGMHPKMVPYRTHYALSSIVHIMEAVL